MRNYIAMIPARMGSKRIPKKNVRYMLDKPLIQYPIELALQCRRFSGVWVNTEDVPLGKAAERMGASFHPRPAELASDTATNRDFVREFLQEHPCDYVVMVNPTSPLLRPETLGGFLDCLDRGEFDTVLSVVSMQEEMFFRDEPLNFSLEEKINSQLLPPVESVVWALTAWKRESFLSMEAAGRNPVFGGKLGKFAIPKDEACDLDTEDDWRIAEGILMSRQVLREKRYLEL